MFKCEPVLPTSTGQIFKFSYSQHFNLVLNIRLKINPSIRRSLFLKPRFELRTSRMCWRCKTGPFSLSLMFSNSKVSRICVTVKYVGPFSEARSQLRSIILHRAANISYPSMTKPNFGKSGCWPDRINWLRLIWPILFFRDVPVSR